MGVDIERFGFLIGRYGMPALYLLLTILAASWVGRRVCGPQDHCMGC